MAPPNVTVQAPTTLFGATYTAPDGSSFAIGATGLLTVPATWLSVLLNAGFTMPSDLAIGLNTGLTAHAGGGQASAIVLKYGFNQLSTVTTRGDSAVLPAAAPGTYCAVVNDGANPAQIFGNGADTINGVAAATGVLQMQNSIDVYYCAVAGAWRVEGGFGFSGQLETNLSQDAMTAHAGGGQGSATAIACMLNRFTSVVSAGDSGVLVAAAPGVSQTVINASAVSMNVFPATGDAINTQAANAAFALPAGGVCTFYSTVAGFWHTLYTNVTASLPFTQNTTIATGNGTLTGAQVAGAALTTLITSGATAQTTPTAALILAAIPNGQVGMSYRLRIVNTNAGTLTITADASVTATGTLTLATNTWREWDVTIVTATTATMRTVGTGTFS